MASGERHASASCFSAAASTQYAPLKSPGPRIPLRHDPDAATARAKELRAQGLSLNQIGERLRKEKLTPLRGGIWHPAQVAKLIEKGLRGDKEAALRRALELREEGTSLREIGIRLAAEGLLPRDGKLWHPASVRALLVGDESAGVGGRLGGGTAAAGRRDDLRPDAESQPAGRHI